MSSPEPIVPVEVTGMQVRAGAWSADLTRLSADGLQLRRLLGDGRTHEARALIQARPAEEQAALVTLDEDPEQVLALTAMDESGRPGYLPAVVDRLPSELLAHLTAPGTRHSRYNPEILRAMSPAVFDRAVREVLDPVDNPELRTRVSWEWLEAVAALDSPHQAAPLLRAVDLSAIEDAIMDKLSDLDLGAVAGYTEVASVSRFQALSEGIIGDRPGEIVEDSDTADTLDALWAAAPELLGPAVIHATRRLYGG